MRKEAEFHVQGETYNKFRTQDRESNQLSAQTGEQPLRHTKISIELSARD